MFLERSNLSQNLGEIQQDDHSNDNKKLLTTAYYYNVANLSREFWLNYVFHQRKFESFPNGKVKAKSIFSHEKEILKNIFWKLTDHKDSAAKAILDFCYHIRSQAKSEIENGNLAAGDAAKATIGKIIYLCEDSWSETAALLQQKDSITRIDEQFETKIRVILEEVHQSCEQHLLTGSLQDPCEVERTIVPLKIATILITSNGLINVSIIDVVTKLFFEDKKNLTNADLEIIQSLQDIKNSLRIQKRLVKQISLSRNAFCNDLARISFGLLSNVEANNYHTNSVRVAAVMTSLEQGMIGRCLSSLIDDGTRRFLKERIFKEMTKRVERVNSLPIVDLGDSDLRKKLIIDREGHVLGIEEVPFEKPFNCFWKIPGIAAALKEFPFEDSSLENIGLDVCERLYEKRFADPKEPIATNVEEIIKAARTLYTFKNPSLLPSYLQDLANLAESAFLAQKSSPILRLWESDILSQVDEEKTLLIRKKLLSSIVDTLKYGMSKKNLMLRAEDQVILTTFEENLKNAIHYQFQETDQRGYFKLYKISQGDRSLSAAPINRPEQFKKLILEVLLKTEEAFKGDYYQKIFQTINIYMSNPDIDQDSFLNEVMRNYDPSCQKIENPCDCWQLLDSLPFRDFSYEDLIEERTPISKLTPPKNGFELFEALITIGRQYPKKIEEDVFKFELSDQPFSIETLDSSIWEVIDDEKIDVREWTKKRFSQMSHSLNNYKLKKKKICQAVIRNLVPKEYASFFVSEIRKIPFTVKTLRDYCNELKKILKPICQMPSSEIFRRLTNILMEILPEEMTDNLKKTSIRVAHANLKKSFLYFVLFLDPISQEIVLGTLDEDGNKLHMFDQSSAWTNSSLWEKMLHEFFKPVKTS